MTNEIEVLVTSKDQTKPGADSARENLDEIGKSAKRVGEIAQGVLAADWFNKIGDAAMRGVQSTFNAAKDLGESVNAVNVSFGESAEQIHDWAESNAASFGLSKAAFNQFAVPLSAVMKNVGVDMDTVTDHTIGLTERAADMASVFNTDVSEALDAIQAGLRGEADPLERFGVGLSAAAVEAKALADTGKESADALTEQEKMLARVALIMEQTSQVQGDFANTSDQAANAQRVATAEMENAKAEIGEAFLPVMAALAQALSGVASWFQELPGPVQTTTAVVMALAGAFVFLAPKILAATTALRGMGVTAKGTGKLMAGVLGPLGLLIAGAQALGDAFSDDLSTDDIQEMDEHLTALVEKGNIKQAEEDFKKFAVVAEAAGFETDEFREMLTGYTSAQDEATGVTEEGTKGQREFAEETEDAADRLDQATEALDEYIAKQRAAVDPVLGLMDALDQVGDAQDGYNEALKEHGKESPEAREAARELAGAVLGAEVAASDADLSFDGFEKKLKQWVNQGKISKEAANVLRNSIKDARGEADKFAGDRVARLKTKIDEAGLAEADNRLNFLARGRTVRVTPTMGRPLGGGIPSFAHGGNVSASHAAEGGPRGNRVLLGEHGAEFVDLAPGSMVHPAGTTRNMLAEQGGGGGTQRVVIELRSSGSAIDEMLLEILRRAIKVRGGSAEVVLSQ